MNGHYFSLLLINIHTLQSRAKTGIFKSAIHNFMKLTKSCWVLKKNLILIQNSSWKLCGINSLLSPQPLFHFLLLFPKILNRKIFASIKIFNLICLCLCWTHCIQFIKSEIKCPFSHNWPFPKLLTFYL